METYRTKPILKWIFGLIAIGASCACGIYLGILSVEGASNGLLIRIVGFGALSLVMAWGALNNR